MSSDRNDEGGAMSLEDLLLGAMLGKCPHEVQLGRVMGVLGALVARNGGPIELETKELEGLDGRALKIEMDRVTGRVTVELLDAPPKAEEPVHVHDAPPSRH